MRNIRSTIATGAVIAGAAIGGAAIANAATTSTTSTTGSATAPATSGNPPANLPAPGTARHEDAEKTVNGTAAVKARAAAVKSVGSGTAGEVTTDFTGNGYEVTVTKTDGSKVEVHLNSSFQVVAGGPAGRGGHDCAGGPGNQSSGSGSGTSSSATPSSGSSQT